MKFIFLDIDGVMNTMDGDVPLHSHILLLKEIVDKTDAKIVLSSSWRLGLRHIQFLIDCFEPYGLTFYGYTPEEVLESELAYSSFKDVEPHFKRKVSYDYSQPGGQGCVIEDRGAEIAYWLIKHKSKVDSFVVLDDDVRDIHQWFPNNYIKTNYCVGLTPHIVEEAINILNNTSYKEIL